ncbi:hypothetical protein B0T25DRAFT_546349 [Lasiosphaeria hispida]|uniref:Uncharacterized protein n=1 Tax=Lasiosphaeria hispida TaxID=260671 RepID=A0AAJ0MBN1_9PEZI|nr:hypothetical protein B0T25DRAFT_546349 [Lasiosphaeria hispida]
MHCHQRYEVAPNVIDEAFLSARRDERRTRGSSSESDRDTGMAATFCLFAAGCVAGESALTSPEGVDCEAIPKKPLFAGRADDGSLGSLIGTNNPSGARSTPKPFRGSNAELRDKSALHCVPQFGSTHPFPRSSAIVGTRRHPNFCLLGEAGIQVNQT